MTIFYNWTFPQFDVAPVEGSLESVVKVIHWRLEATDGAVSAEAYGSSTLDPASAASFIPFAQITEQWAVDEVSALIEVDQIKDSLVGQINKKKTPAVIAHQPPFAPGA